MPRKLLRRILPDYREIRQYKAFRVFGNLLHEPDLWHLNRRSVSGAFSLGLFWTFIPIPTQMLFSAACALVLRVNIPVALATVWITNPITIAPIFYFCYRVGAWVLGQEPTHFAFELSFEWLIKEIGLIWQPLLVGSLIVSVVSAALGYVAVRVLWWAYVVRRMHLRRERRRLRRSGRGA
jgi:uncharacterized protein (DUF2062 family)